MFQSASKSVVAIALLLGACININTSGGGGSPGGTNQGSGPGDDNMNSPGDAGLGSATSTGAISVTVDAMTTAATIDGVGGPSTDYFVILTLAISNSGAAPLSASDALFALTTNSPVVYQAAPIQPQDVCDASVMIASGARLQCSIAFDIPLAELPIALRYDDGQGDTATITLPVLATPDAACESVEQWTARGLPSCLDCTASSCASAGNAYTSQCSACVSACASSGNVCACYAGCNTSACSALFDEYSSCLVATCSSTCT